MQLMLVAGAAFASGLWNSSALAAVINVPGDQATIQGAINAANAGDEIVVAPGFYAEHLNMMGKAITLRSIDPSDRAIVTSTIVDGTNNGIVIQCVSGENAGTLIAGLTLKNGNGAFGPSFGGGGMLNDGSSPTIEDCVFMQNTGDQGGGMLNINFSHPAITRCTFEQNLATGAGGGMNNRSGSSPTVTDCDFVENTSDGSAGGMLNIEFNTEPVITNCLFRGNVAATSGGAMVTNSAAPTLINCSFLGNEATGGGGGGVSLGPGDPVLLGCLFSGNSAIRGGGIFCGSSARMTAANCTVVGNTAGFGGSGVYLSLTGDFYILQNFIIWGNVTDNFVDASMFAADVAYSLIEGGYPDGTHILNVEPMFVDADGGDDIFGTEDDDLRLLAGSPCIDAGLTSIYSSGASVDLDGNPRFVDDPDTSDTGSGVGPKVDIGAYEFQVAAMVCPGDADGDNDIDLDDLQVVLFNFGGSVAPFADGDADGDGDVDLDDLQVVLFSFGTSC
ncbi:MAG: right-handed parallel beta-helix repeat-containing protein [Phycisphaerales bacterium]|nr:right-handed parallel beta-helix repeat-containing protein [Phycisphaerales bacterium]